MIDAFKLRNILNFIKISTLAISIISIYLVILHKYVYYNKNEIRHAYTNPMKCYCANRSSSEQQQQRITIHSSCGIDSTLRGPGQKVVSYSFYGDITNDYFPGLECNAKAVKEKYPGWLMRIYHNLNTTQHDINEAFCNLWCKYDHVDFCHVEHLPPPFYNQTAINPRAWRFFAMGDPLIERFISRDADHRIMDREVAAVNQWIASGKTWHFMHDYPGHQDPIFGGMFGGVNRNITLNLEILEEISIKQVGQAIEFDQTVLNIVLMPIAEKTGDYMNHDSYNCGKRTKLFTPWPTQRPAVNVHVGIRCVRIPGLSYNLTGNPCPVLCRPPQHQDWLYC